MGGSVSRMRLTGRLAFHSLFFLALVACAAPPDRPTTQHTASEPPTPTASEAGPPNVVVIYVDDLGYGDLASYGHHTIETPYLDNLAQQGMRFTDFYAPSPLCSPSRAALLTGRTPFRTGIENWIPENEDVQLGPDEITLATLLKEQGYATFLGGKWHLNGSLDPRGTNEQPNPHTQPQDHGFDHWLALNAFPLPNGRNATNFFRNGEPLPEVDGFAAGVVLDETLAFLEQHRAESDAPFFVYLATVEPHGMIASPDEYNQRYAEFTRGTARPFINGTTEPSTDLEARGPGEYYANISYLDAQIGRLLDYLDEHQLSGNTIVFFASDNGPVTTDWRHWWEVNLYGSTGGFRGRKADLYEGGIRVPAIARWPGRIEPGSTSGATLSAYDLLPTLAAIVGFEPPADRPIDGEDFSSVLLSQQSAFERQRPLYWEFDDDQGYHFALRDGRYKLLADKNTERVVLYDLETDPFEVVNLAEREAATRDRLLAQLEEIHQSVLQDPLRPASPAGRPGFRGD